MSDVTRILSQIHDGDPLAAEQLLPLVYEELRKLAAAKMAREKPGQTLQPTALVHEAYIRLVRAENASTGTIGDISFVQPPRRCGGFSWNKHVTKERLHHAAEHPSVDLQGFDVPAELPSEDLLALHEALTRSNWRMLRQLNWSNCGSSLDFLCLRSPSLWGFLASAERNWMYARTWLHRAIFSERSSRPTAVRDSENFLAGLGRSRRTVLQRAVAGVVVMNTSKSVPSRFS